MKNYSSMQQTDIKSRSYVKVMVHCTRFKKAENRRGCCIFRHIRTANPELSGHSRVCQLEGGLKARPLDFTGFEGYKN